MTADKKMKKKGGHLTLKQEAFCQAYIETGNASEAYRQSYNTENMKPETVNRNAKALLDNNKIATRLEALQVAHQKRHNVTVDSITEMLLGDHGLAREKEQAAAAVGASMGLAKLHGMLKDKIELSGAVDLSATPEWTGLQTAIMAALNPYPEARRAVLDALEAQADGQP